MMKTRGVTPHRRSDTLSAQRDVYAMLQCHETRRKHAIHRFVQRNRGSVPYLGTSGACHKSLAHLLHREHGGRLDVIPLLLEEHVLGLLLASLLALGHALVLADRHLALMGGRRDCKRESLGVDGGLKAS